MQSDQLWSYGSTRTASVHSACSLINYGRIKSETAEKELPGFDIRRQVGRKLESLKGRRGVLAVVVDVTDFDGSLPRWALSQVSLVDQVSAWGQGVLGVERCQGIRLAGSGSGEIARMLRNRSIERARSPETRVWYSSVQVILRSWERSATERGTVVIHLLQIYPRGPQGEMAAAPWLRVMLIANKIDLLPRYVSRVRLEQWIRRRARQVRRSHRWGIASESASRGANRYGNSIRTQCIRRDVT